LPAISFSKSRLDAGQEAKKIKRSAVFEYLEEERI
jgi:hypothetical protein